MCRANKLTDFYMMGTLVVKSLKVPNFRTITYVTLQQKSEGGGEGGGSLSLLACKVLRNFSCINLTYYIYKQRKNSRNALLINLHCRSYASLILKHIFSILFIHSK